MPWVMRLRRAVARALPPPVKRVLKRVLPRSLVSWAPPVRRFDLAMPAPPPDLGPAVRPTASPPRVRITAPWRSYVPRLLEEHGVGGYEPETMAAFLAAISLLAEGDAGLEVFDVGANVGIFAITASALTTASVTGFEPTPQLANTFAEIARANGLECRVEQLALGSASGTATLFLSAQSDSSNSLRAGFRTAKGTVEVPVERLDDYVARTGRRPRLLKIDTETTEPEVLAGGLATLTATRPWVICEVLAGKTEAPLGTILGPLGYRFHHLADGGPIVETDRIVGDNTYRHRDWLFTPDPLPEGFAAHYAAWREALRAVGTHRGAGDLPG